MFGQNMASTLRPELSQNEGYVYVKGQRAEPSQNQSYNVTWHKTSPLQNVTPQNITPQNVTPQNVTWHKTSPVTKHHLPQNVTSHKTSPDPKTNMGFFPLYISYICSTFSHRTDTHYLITVTIIGLQYMVHNYDYHGTICYTTDQRRS
jgi:hypothetical protein